MVHPSQTPTQQKLLALTLMDAHENMLSAPYAKSEVICLIIVMGVYQITPSTTSRQCVWLMQILCGLLWSVTLASDTNNGPQAMAFQ